MWDQDGGAQSGSPRDRSVPTPQDPWEAVAPDPWPSAPHGLNPHGLDPHGLDPHGFDPHGFDPRGGHPPGAGPPGGPRPVDPTQVDDPPPAGYASGRARVPKPAKEALRRPTTEMPPVEPTRRSDPPVLVSWHRPSRERMRALSDGWGFSATGLLFAFIGWGIWAASIRAEEPTRAPLLWFGIICGVAVGVFVVCRLIGRVLIGQVLGRPRRHARWSHLVAGLFLTVCGVFYLGEANWGWIEDGVGWVESWFD